MRTLLLYAHLEQLVNYENTCFIRFSFGTQLYAQVHSLGKAGCDYPLGGLF